MDQCTICKDVLKYLGAAFLSLYVSCFSRKQCDPAAQVKGKCMITSLWEVRLLCPRVGELVQSHCLGVGKPLFVSLLVWFC